MKIFLGRCVYRNLEAGHVVCYETLLLHLQKNDVPFVRYTHVGDGLISRARSIVATKFVDGDIDLDIPNDCDVLVSIDADITFKAEDVLKIAQEACDKQAIVGGLYMTRSLRSWPAISPFVDVPLRMEKAGTLTPVRYVNTGFMAIPRAVFEKLKELNWELTTLSGEVDRSHHVHKVKFGQTGYFYTFYAPFVIPWQDGLAYLSEDWACCHRAKSMGFEIFIDSSVRLGHVGDYEFTLEDMVMQRPAPFPMVVEVIDGAQKLHVERLFGGATVE